MNPYVTCGSVQHAPWHMSMHENHYSWEESFCHRPGDKVVRRQALEYPHGNEIEIVSSSQECPWTKNHQAGPALQNEAASLPVNTLSTPPIKVPKSRKPNRKSVARNKVTKTLAKPKTLPTKPSAKTYPRQRRQQPSFCDEPGCYVSVSRKIDLRRHKKAKHGTDDKKFRCLLCTQVENLSPVKMEWRFTCLYNLTE